MALSAAPKKSPVGKWTGHLHFTLKAAAKAKLTPEQLAQQKKMAESFVIKLDILKNGTFSVTGVGQPQGSTGKWKQSGNKVTLTNDQATGTNKSQVAVLSADGKKLTIKLPENPNADGSVIFTR